MAADCALHQYIPVRTTRSWSKEIQSVHSVLLCLLPFMTNKMIKKTNYNNNNSCGHLFGSDPTNDGLLPCAVRISAKTHILGHFGGNFH